MDYQEMTVDELRPEVRQRGWTGPDVLKAKKKELVQFLTTGKRPDQVGAGPLAISTNGDAITVTNGKCSITAERAEWQQVMLAHFPGNSADSGTDSMPGNTKRESKTGKKIGRPKAFMPEDHEPFVISIYEADRQGRPFYKTSINGVHARRHELPPPYDTIGKHRISEIVTLLQHEKVILTRSNGTLYVPGFPESSNERSNHDGTDTCNN